MKIARQAVKVERVINSCKTKEQLECAKKYSFLFLDKLCVYDSLTYLELFSDVVKIKVKELKTSYE